MDRKSWIEVFVLSTSYEVRDLIPGSDYGVTIQSVLGSDTSQAVHWEFSTRKRHTYTQEHTVTHTEKHTGLNAHYSHTDLSE